MDCPRSLYSKFFFLKNRRLRPLVKIIINFSNFLTRYRTIVFFKEEKNLSGLLTGKKFSVSRATCPELVFKTVQIILWETPVIKSSREVFINVNLVRVLPLRTNLASFLINKHFLKKMPVGSCAKSFILLHFIRFSIHSELQFVMLHTGLLHFELQAMR